MSNFNKVCEYTNLRFEYSFSDLKLTVTEVNPKYIHSLTDKKFDSEDGVNSYIDELLSKRPRFLTLSKTLDKNEMKAIYKDEVDILGNKPTEIKKFTVEHQYQYTLSDEYYDLYETFNSIADVRYYLSDKYGLFAGNFEFTGDVKE